MLTRLGYLCCHLSCGLSVLCINCHCPNNQHPISIGVEGCHGWGAPGRPCHRMQRGRWCVSVVARVATENLGRITDLNFLGVVVLDGDRRVLHRSEFAKQNFRRWRLLVRGGVLRLSSFQEDVQFRETVAKVVREGRKATLALNRPNRHVPLILRVAPLEQPNQLLLLVRDPAWMAESDVQTLRELFGLTQREAQLASYLSCGYTLNDFAESRYLAMNTVKSHLKKIFKKAGVQSQMQLVSVVLSALR